jgi:hypothetical protein
VPAATLVNGATAMAIASNTDLIVQSLSLKASCAEGISDFTTWQTAESEQYKQPLHSMGSTRRSGLKLQPRIANIID